ncbi:MAG TPA: hypothetical protein VNV15_09360 [Opitutaceae bacterium]|nr:hypothetical protein [Opitutaceae bacterium]
MGTVACRCIVTNSGSAKHRVATAGSARSKRAPARDAAAAGLAETSRRSWLRTMLIAAGAFASVPSLLLFSPSKAYGEGGGTDYSPKQDLEKYQDQLNQAQQAAAQAQADYEKEKATNPNANMAPMLDAQGKVQGLENMVKYEQQQAAQQPQPSPPPPEPNNENPTNTTTEPNNEAPTNNTPTTTEPNNENPQNPTNTVQEPTYQNPQNPPSPTDTGPTDGPVHIEPGAAVQPSPNPTTTEPTNENPTNTTTTTTEPANENPTNTPTTTTEPTNENPANTTTTGTETTDENPANSQTMPVSEPTYNNQPNPAQPDANDVLHDAPNSNKNSDQPQSGQLTPFNNPLPPAIDQTQTQMPKSGNDTTPTHQLNAIELNPDINTKQTQFGWDTAGNKNANNFSVPISTPQASPAGAEPPLDTSSLPPNDPDVKNLNKYQQQLKQDQAAADKAQADYNAISQKDPNANKADLINAKAKLDATQTMVDYEKNQVKAKLPSLPTAPPAGTKPKP